MKFMSARKMLGAVFAVALLATVMPAYAQTGGVEGKATLQNGKPCVKCIIRIQRLDITGNYKTKTGKKGGYIYIGLPYGTYKVFLEDPTGRPLFYIGKRIDPGDPTHIDFDLRKLLSASARKKQQQEMMKEHPELAKKMAEQAKQVEQQKEQQQKFTGLRQYFQEGNTLFGQKQYKEAAAAFEKAVPLATGKNLTVVLGRLGESYSKAGENAQAVATYQKVLQLTPNDAALHNNLGTVYAGMGKFQEAQAQFEKAATLDPTNAGRYYYNMGAVLYNTGRMDEALVAFKKVISLDPKNALAYYLEGQALMGKATTGPDGKVKAPDGTIEAFQQYLKLDPDGPNAAAAKAMIATLQGSVSTQYKK